MKYKWLISLLGILFSSFASAQTVSNVVARQVGGTVEITYNLDMPADISVQLSLDGGESYTITPKALTGNIGQGIKPGHNKIVWNLLADSTDWDIKNARFKVIPKKLDKLTFTIRGVSFTMVFVEGGTFTMGASFEQRSVAENDENPPHQVTLKSYYIGQTEVTQELWNVIMGSNQAYYKKGGKYPIESVTWDDCQNFVKQLNKLLASELGEKRFALPTEAQWEFAARGGNTIDTDIYKYSGSESVGLVAWFADNGSKITHSVASKMANKLGIYDMSGNVWEWCEDFYGDYSNYPQIDPIGSGDGNRHVYRGGCVNSPSTCCRVSYRNCATPGTRTPYLGFRIVCR